MKKYFRIVMQIKLVKHNEIDKLKWDNTINNSLSPKIYALSWYLDITSPNWDALIKDDYEQIFPIPTKQKWQVLSYIPTPFFTQQLGVFSKNELNEDELNDFISLLPKTYVRKNILLNSSNPKLHSASERTNFILSLTNHDEIKSNYSTQIKRNIKSSLKHELSFSKGDGYNSIIDLFLENKANSIEKIDYTILKKLCKEAVSRDQLKCYSVYDKTELLAGILLFNHLDRLYLIMLSSSDNGKKNGASSALIDFVIKENSGKGFTLDFEGSNIPSLARFYKGFGSINEPYQLYSKRLF